MKTTSTMVSVNSHIPEAARQYSIILTLYEFVFLCIECNILWISKKALARKSCLTYLCLAKVIFTVYMSYVSPAIDLNASCHKKQCKNFTYFCRE